jgi:homeobox-leucine zipper protein
VNGFVEDGWATMISDGIGDVSVVINESATTKCGQIASEMFLCTLGGGILCAKALMHLQVDWFSEKFCRFIFQCFWVLSILPIMLNLSIYLHLEENGIQNVPATLFLRFLQEHCSEWVDCDIDASAAAAFYSTTGNGTAGYSQLSFPLVNSSEQEEVLPPAHCTALGSHFLMWNAPYLSVWELLYLNGDRKTVTQVK